MHGFTKRTLAAAAAMTLCACSEETPVEDADIRRSIKIPAAPGGSGAWAVTMRAEHIVGAFYKALSQGHIHQARQMVFGSDNPKRHDRLTKELETFAGMLLSKKIEVEVRESTKAEKCALVVVTMTRNKDGKSQTRVREEFVVVHRGEWFIVPEAMRSDPAVRPILEKHGKPLFDAFRKRLPELQKKYQ